MITFDPDNANDITVQLTKLRTYGGPVQALPGESTSHIVYFGKLLLVTGMGMLSLCQKLTPLPMPLKISRCSISRKECLFQRFSGQATAGLDFTRTSGFGRIDYDGKLSYNAKKGRAYFINFGYIYFDRYYVQS